MKRRFRNTEYFVTSDGRVFRNGRELKPWTHVGRRGFYKRVTLSIEGRKRGYRVHRLVAELFLSNRRDKDEVHHKDGNTFNNSVFNLQWVDRKENEQAKQRNVK